MTASTYKTCCHRVLEILVDAKRKELRWNLQNDSTKPAEYAPPGYLPVYELRGPIGNNKGGDSGDRRLRELRTEFGIPIKKTCYQWKTDPKRRTWLYSLDCDPEMVDMERRCLREIKIDNSGQVKMVLT